MSLFNQRIHETQKEEQAIIEKVESTYVKLTPEERMKSKEIIHAISEQFSDRMVTQGIDSLSYAITDAVTQLCDNIPDFTLESRLRIKRAVLMTVLGNGVIEEYIRDPSVTEIVVQRYDNIVIERAGKIQKADAIFDDEAQLQTIIGRIVQSVNRQLNTAHPIVDARLKDGSRVNATLPPVSPDGATLTIRKFNQNKLTGNDYLAFGSLNRYMLYFLQKCVKGRLNLFVSGGTGTGKTTMLNMLSMYIPSDELIITIEDTLELKLQQPNVRRMEVRTSTSKEMMQVDQKALVKAALRQRPDRIILGETRDGSVMDLISAMSTGHEGSMSTIHANSPQNMCDTRIPILYYQNAEASNFTEKSIAMQISEAIQIIVQLSRYPDGSRKVSEISFIDGVDKTGRVRVRPLFYYDRLRKIFDATGTVPDALIEKLALNGIDIDTKIFRPVERGENELIDLEIEERIEE